MPRFAPFRRALPVLAAAALAACATAPQSASVGNAGAARDMVIRELQESATAWNNGDLEGFLKPYSRNPEATFVGADVVHGYDAIRDFYRSSWWRTGTPTLNLVYRDIDVRPLGPNHLLVVGHWAVSNKQTGAETRKGIFSLTFARTPDGWRIIHDHSG